MPETTNGHKDGHATRTPLPKEAKPRRRAAHNALSAFVGDWRGEGQGGDTPMTAEESYDWLEGGFFLTGKFSQLAGKARHTGVCTIGYSDARKTYQVRMVDNLGYAREYEMRDLGYGVWTLSGERERAVYTFEGEDKLNVQWEQATDGVNWQPLCEFDCVNRRLARVH